MSNLIITEGPDKGKVLPLTDFISIGTNAANDLILNDQFVSKKHAVIRKLGKRYQIEDQGSRNKTIVNNNAVKNRLLKSNDEITLGETVIVFSPDFELKVEEADKHLLYLVKQNESENIIESLPVDTEDFWRVLPSRQPEKTINQLQIMLKLSLGLGSPQEPKSLLKKLAKLLFGIFQADRVFIMLRDDKTGEYNSLTSCLKNSSDSLVTSKTIIEHVTKNKVAVCSSDALRDPRFRQTESITQYNLRSVICAPMFVGDRPIGIIQIDCLEETDVFSAEDLRFLAAIASLAAITVDNSRVFHEKKREAERFRELLQKDVQIIGQGKGLKQALDMAQKVARTDSTVLILGESGTGKELIARLIHQLSPRAEGPFVDINCAVISENLLESELFGHVKGSFTGAIKDKAGKFELADGGSLFLDEIGEMSPQVQVKLLRVLQERKIERVGDNRQIPVDIRIITATNKDLAQEIKDKHFRNDLYYRIKVISIDLPPLRERVEDIPLLADYFREIYRRKLGKEINGISDNAMQALQRYSWPGNIRELENVIERAVVLCEGPIIDVDDLPMDIKLSANINPASKLGSVMKGELPERIVELESKTIRRVLEETNWVKSATAQRLGISRPTLDKKMRELGIHGNVE